MESSAKPGAGNQPMEGSAKPVPPASHGQAQATADLFADLRKMLNNPKFSDVVFVCQDRVPVHASRMLLTARSPVLSSILKNNKDGEISLPDIPSASILSIFEFLYTGTMIEHAPLSSSKAYELISAAKYFQLRNVEELVREFLVNSTADGVDDMTKAALRLSVALEFGTLSGTMGGHIPVSLVRILDSRQLEPPHLRELSEKALRYFLQRTQSTADPETVSFGEYLRFRHIILWCVTQVCPDEASYVVRWCLPDAKSAARILREARKMEFSRPPPPREASSREAVHLTSLLVRRPESAALLDSLLTLVDLRRVHAELLVAVVEPLKIVPAAQLMEAFRFQALHHKSGLTAAKAPLYHWEHGGSYSTVGDGLAIRKISDEVGFARFTVPIARPYGVYEWDIIVEELCVGFCEIGLHNVDGLQDGKPNFTGSTLSQQPTGWALNHDAINGTRISQRGGNDAGGWIDFDKDFAHKSARVRLHLDMFERSCSFSVDGDEFLTAWMNLPHGVYFPAVSLGVGSMGRARIEIVNGFDML